MPVRCAQSGKGRHDIDAAVVAHLACKVFAVGGVLDHTQLVAQPLDHRAADKDAALQRILHRLTGTGRGNGRHQSAAAEYRCVAGVGEQKAAGAVGDLEVALLQTALTVERRLLVAGDAADRHMCAHQVHFAVDLAAAPDLGQHAHGNVEQRAQLRVPLAGVDVVEHGARGVGAVGHMHLAVGQLPQQPGVHRAEQQLAAVRQLTRSLHIVEDPFDFGAAEIGVELQTRFLRDQLRTALSFQRVAEVGSAAALPDDRVINRLARPLVPDDRGLALIRHADAGDLVGRYAALGDTLRHGAVLVGVNIHRILLDPARTGIDLRKFVLCHAHHVAFAVKQNAARTRCALVQGENILFHSVLR